MQPKTRLRCLVAAAAAAVLGCESPQAKALDQFWGSFTSGQFTDPARWFTGVVPGPGDVAIFRVFGNNPAPYTVTFPGQSILLPPKNYTNTELRVGPNTVDFVPGTGFFVGPPTYTLTSSIEVGEGTGPSVLNTSLLALAAPTASVGFLAGSPGTLNVNSGAFNVTGSGSGFELAVGDNGPGTINVNAGARINVTGLEGNAIIGAAAGVTGAVNVSGAGAVWNLSGGVTAPLVIGGSGVGSLSVTAGGQLNNSVSLIAQNPGSIGSVTVSGSGSVWTNSSSMVVGENGSGFLTVSNGGQATCDFANVGPNSTSVGTVLVTGAGSTWQQGSDLVIGGTQSLNGVSGTGTLQVTLGGRVLTGHDASIGTRGNAQVSIDGAGSQWTVGNQLLINRDTRLTIASGGQVAGNAVAVGGAVDVSGAGSEFDATDYLQVNVSGLGLTSAASVRLTAGAKAVNRVAFIGGGGFGGLGNVSLDNPGTSWTSTDQLYVGLSGRGDVTVSGGAQLTTGAAQLGVGPNTIGTVTVTGAGSTWNNPGTIVVGVGGTGQLTVSTGGAVSTGAGLPIGPRGTVEGNGTITANVRNDGTVSPGVAGSPIPNDFVGTLRIAGNYTQSAGAKFLVDVGSASLADRLAVTGDADLAGSMQVTLAAAYTPVAGDRFTVLTAAHRTGVFAPTALLNPSPVVLVPAYTPTEVLLIAANLGETTWGVDAGGNSSVGSNWLGGVAPGGVDAKVAFTTVISADRTVTVDSGFTAGSILFDDDNNYLLQGPGVITMQVSAGDARVAAKNLHGNGTHTISAPMRLESRTVFDVPAGSSTLRVTGQMTAAPGVIVGKTGAGTLAVRNVRADGLAVNGGTLSVLNNGGVDGVSVVSALDIAPAARLDLNDNDLLVPYPGPTSPYTTIRDFVIKGLATATGGIVSSAAQTAGNTADAVVDNTRLHLTSFNGLPIDDTTILVKYTLKGDANLDGAVNFSDLVPLAQNYNNTSGAASWDMGDFNYDGNVNFLDLVGLAQNYNSALPAEAIPGAAAGFEQDLQAAFAAVPEPAGGAALSLLACCGLFRRTRRR